jgi:hypothetical protein
MSTTANNLTSETGPSTGPEPLILNQYRRGSGYKDVVGEVYHFPNRYLTSFGALPIEFIYYEPRQGGEQVYFGTGVVRSVVSDSEDNAHSYADIDQYQPFETPLSFFAGPNGDSWEPAATMRNSVRRIPRVVFDGLIRAAGVAVEPAGVLNETLYESKLDSVWSELTDKFDNLSLRKKRRVLEAYERPSWITNRIKRLRGDRCQLCGHPGFLKRDGRRYCEVHHLFHLSDNPPADCLRPSYVVVLCATCHRRLHFANVGLPERVESGWRINVDGEWKVFITEENSKVSSA